MSDLYVQAAIVLDGALAQSGSLKGLVMARAKATRSDAKRLLALTANTLAFLRALETVLQRADVVKKEQRSLQPAAKGCSVRALALVVAHDLLLTKRGRIATSPAWPPHAAFVRHAVRLKAELVKLQIQQGKASVQELRTGEATKQRAERIPRWIRVNERLTTVEEVVTTLESEGWKQVHEGYDLAAKKKTFARSRHLPCVLAVHAAHTSFLLGHSLYTKGHVMLQDLASCFPAQILLGTIASEASSIHALDATSAPGNKTSHLSAKLAHGPPGSRVTALEHSKPRFETLLSQLRRAGALDASMPGRVKAVLGDFTKQKHAEYSDVTHMLLDPSCSGSGILGRLDYLTEEQGDDEGSEGGISAAASQQQERLKNLSAFQSSMIEHAMNFPSLRRLVYSTCSIHHEENEDVVMRALESKLAKQHGWRLARRGDVIASWQTRGLVEYCHNNADYADAMIRCVPGGAGQDGEDKGPSLNATNGFFVACFVRDEADKAAIENEGDVPVKRSNTDKNRKRKQRAKEKAREKKRAKVEV